MGSSQRILAPAEAAAAEASSAGLSSGLRGQGGGTGTTVADLATGSTPSAAGLRCRCEDYDCTCERQCACSILGDADGHIAGNSSSALLPASARAAAAQASDLSVGYLFRCGCAFGVTASTAEYDSMDCKCRGAAEAPGSKGCRCSRRCVCEDPSQQAGAAASGSRAAAAESGAAVEAGASA